MEEKIKGDRNLEKDKDKEQELVNEKYGSKWTKPKKEIMVGIKASDLHGPLQSSQTVIVLHCNTFNDRLLEFFWER